MGEQGIYFVEGMPPRRLINPLYGWHQGHYLIERDARGVEKVRRMDAEVNIYPQRERSTRSLRADDSHPDSPAAFKARIKDVLEGAAPQ